MGKKVRKKKKNSKKKNKKNKNRNQNRELHQDNPNLTEKSVVEQKEYDLISVFTDEILTQIISLLPLKEAVQTSYLSSRWRNLWRKAFELRGTIEYMEKLITAFLDHHFYDQKLDVFSSRRWLQYHFNQSSTLLVTIIENQKLQLAFSNVEEHEMPEKFDCCLKLHRQNLTKEPSPFGFFNVRVLCLTSLRKLTNETVSSLVSNFQLLEKLKIAECKGLRSLRIEAKSKLRSLTILDCPQIDELCVFAYHLYTYRFRGLLPWFWFKYVPHLQDAMLDYRQGPKYYPFSIENLLSHLFSLNEVKVITLCGWFFEVPIPRWLSTAGTILERGDFVFNNLKELWWIDSSMEGHKMDTLVSVLKLCPSLEKLFITIDPASYCNTNEGKPSFWSDYSNRVESYTRLDYLRLVMFEGFTSQEEQILLAKHLLEEVVSVEPVIVARSYKKGPNKIWPQRLVKVLCSERKHRPKTAEIQKPETEDEEVDIYLEFVEEECDVYESRVQHPHMSLYR